MLICVSIVLLTGAAVSFTTGVPAMIGAMMMLTGRWRAKGVFNVEAFDPEPFMTQLGCHGLPWTERFLDSGPEGAGG